MTRVGRRGAHPSRGLDEGGVAGGDAFGRPRVAAVGGGERKTLRFVARDADACNPFASDPAVAVPTLDVLARRRDAEGRDPVAIEPTVTLGSDPLDEVDAFLASLSDAKLGIDRVWVGPPVPGSAAWVVRVTARVVRPVARIGLSSSARSGSPSRSTEGDANPSPIDQSTRRGGVGPAFAAPPPSLLPVPPDFLACPP